CGGTSRGTAWRRSRWRTGNGRAGRSCGGRRRRSSGRARPAARGEPTPDPPSRCRGANSTCAPSRRRSRRAGRTRAPGGRGAPGRRRRRCAPAGGGSTSVAEIISRLVGFSRGDAFESSVGRGSPDNGSMKLLMLIVPREARDDAEAALEAAGALGFTEVPGVYGDGATGPRFGSRAAPGGSGLCFAALEDRATGRGRRALAALPRAGRVHAFVIPAQELAAVAESSRRRPATRRRPAK